MQILSIANDFVELMKALGTGLMGFIVSIFNGVIDIFYLPGSEGVEGGFTLYGMLLIAVAVVGFIYLAIRFITGFFKRV